jgi:lipopolysaccharide/colanic/teichoic acid biosynthesis glycosyltransferase|tara:strand:- start:1383 stop:1871 length:489 start_codon:yes stop_codon:yes gene_type:complete
MLYKSTRIGKNLEPFVLYKFRTMVKDADKIGPPSTADDDPRITTIGKFLRKTKLDEIPQLWNVLKGDMALVGPRPEVPGVVDLMTDEEKEVIFSVKPGITDLATLSNMDEGAVLEGEFNPHQAYLEKIWPEKKRLQILYVQTKSFWGDVKIILWTIKGLLWK